MIPAPFDYVRATSLARPSACCRGSRRQQARGRRSYVDPDMKLRLASPPLLIDIGGIDELRGIQVATASGSAPWTTHAECLRRNR